jgi:hypothetical protein
MAHTPLKTIVVAEPGTHPLHQLAANATRHAQRHRTPALEQLPETLLSLDPQDSDELATQAIHHIGQALLAAWTELSSSDRERYEQRAEDDLGDLVALLDEARLTALLEEHARGLFREEFTGLDATTVIHEVLC